MREPTRRQRAQRDKQQRITQAAAELFRTQGFDATTTDQIAERADIAKGTLFLYAPTKLHLLVLVYEDDLTRLVAETFAAARPDAPVVSTITQLFLPFFQLYEQDVELARRFVREQLFLEPRTESSASALRQLLERLVALIQEWQAAGRVAADVDAMLAAQNTFALYFAVLVAWLSKRLLLEVRDERLQASLELYWRGLVVAAQT
jgi:TetR/AcrR family transcriptional regulator, cholesterol catabolism regulator